MERIQDVPTALLQLLREVRTLQPPEEYGEEDGDWEQSYCDAIRIVGTAWQESRRLGD